MMLKFSRNRKTSDNNSKDHFFNENNLKINIGYLKLRKKCL